MQRQQYPGQVIGQNNSDDDRFNVGDYSTATSGQMPGTPYYGHMREDHFINAELILPKKQQWLFQDLFPIGEIAGVFGDEGVGKTTIHGSLAAMASNSALALPCGDKHTISANMHGNVLWIAAEDCVDTTLVPRAIAAGANMQNIAFWCYATLPKFKTKNCSNSESALIQKIRKSPGVVLVLLDNFDLIFEGYPDSKYGRKRALLDITNLARSMGFAIVANGHFANNAARTTNPLARICGGKAISTTVRKVLYVEEMPRDLSYPESRRFALFDTKTSITGDRNGLLYTTEGASFKVGETLFETSKIRWLGHISEQIIDDLKSRSCRAVEPRVSRLDHAITFVRDFLANGPRLVADLNEAAKVANISSKTLSTARAELGVLSWKEQGAGQFSSWKCSLPVDDAAADSAKEASAEVLQPRQVNHVSDAISQEKGPEDHLMT